MGKFDRRNSQKMKRRRAQEKLKIRQRKERAEHATRAAAATKKGKKLSPCGADPPHARRSYPPGALQR